ncbi:FAD-binding oxidoreductase [Acinetobacter larvae]|nr:FAD-binding oxidoreductase [Acinetobacter larvae]
MNKKIYVMLLILFLALMAIPSGYLIRVKLNEAKSNSALLPAIYRDDASHLNLTRVRLLVNAAEQPEQLHKQLKALLQYAQQNHLNIALAGAKHSMGGQSISPDGIVINMLPYRAMQFDVEQNILTIGSGATWQDAIQYLDRYGKSIAIMQSFSNFSIGGSISVNGHGWQKNAAPISSSIVSFTLMLADGNIVNCSRQQNPELFKLVIGGYGLFGIILDVKLKVVDNTALKFHSVSLKPAQYHETYQALVTEQEHIQFAYGRLKISNKGFLQQATLNYFEKTNQAPVALAQQAPKNEEIRRIVFRGSVNNEYGKRLRWDLENALNLILPYSTFSRNEILSEDAALIENHDPNSTDILHEYFIPKQQLAGFIEDIKPILHNSPLDLLNITIREVKKDSDAYMNYAREDVFGLVFLFNQRKNVQQEQQMKVLSNQLLDVALQHHGTFYLPYRLHISPEKMRRAYPQAQQFFALKKKYDPNEIFSNQLYNYYAP